MSMNNLRQASQGGNPVSTVGTMLTKHIDQIKNALPKQLDPQRMIRLAMTALSQSRDLQECSPQSLFGSVILAAQMGLEIGVNGQGYLIPYKGKATFVPGWKGLVDLANRSGRVSVWTGAVFQGDRFRYARGTSPFIEHEDAEDPGDLTHVYAVGRVNGAEWPVIDVWPIAKIWKHRDRFNKVGGKHYSYAHPEMYARKIPLLQVLKYMPASIELSNAIAAAEADGGLTIDGQFMTVDDLDAGADGGKANANAAPTKEDQEGQSKGAAFDEAEILADIQSQSAKAKSLDDLGTARDLLQYLVTDAAKAAANKTIGDRMQGLAQSQSQAPTQGKKYK